ncbi:MAG TPA: hypothetical protein P5323_02400 [Candidatus Moranbacteria bacterium]|nr:hypothetical protein [Candidatus Moranbacteria bacterium]HRY27963.1 hypothetical protein [Candidatus Moranbacteria bacterium]HSA08221.1 hypothetical protein [Candidatus Moranbacteria bacterium]
MQKLTLKHAFFAFQIPFFVVFIVAGLGKSAEASAEETFYQKNIFYQNTFDNLIPRQKLDDFNIADNKTQADEALPGNILGAETLENTVKNAPEKPAQQPIAKKAPVIITIGKPGPIAAKTEIRNGKRTCKDMKKDDPSKSKNNKKGHIDAECCLDLDETPNAHCYYPPEKYGKIIQKYLSKKK